MKMLFSGEIERINVGDRVGVRPLCPCCGGGLALEGKDHGKSYRRRKNRKSRRDGGKDSRGRKDARAMREIDWENLPSRETSGKGT